MQASVGLPLPKLSRRAKTAKSGAYEDRNKTSCATSVIDDPTPSCNSGSRRYRSLFALSARNLHNATRGRRGLVRRSGHSSYIERVDQESRPEVVGPLLRSR